MDGFRNELNDITRVTSKLLETNNKDVFNKLCFSCLSFYNKVISQPKNVIDENRKEIIAILKELKQQVLTLKSFGEYLSHLDGQIDNSIQTLSNEEKSNIDNVSTNNENINQTNNEVNSTLENVRKKTLNDGINHTFVKDPAA